MKIQRYHADKQVEDPTNDRVTNFIKEGEANDRYATQTGLSCIAKQEEVQGLRSIELSFDVNATQNVDEEGDSAKSCHSIGR